MGIYILFFWNGEVRGACRIAQRMAGLVVGRIRGGTGGTLVASAAGALLRRGIAAKNIIK